MSTRFPFFDTRFFTREGVPAAGYFLHQYVSGSTTDQDTFTDSAGLVANVHPITLDSDGRCTLYGTPGDIYTFVLEDPAGIEPDRSWDDVEPNPVAAGSSFLPLAGGTMLGQITLAANAAAALQPVTLQQLNTSLAALASSVSTAVAAANAAAAAAEAAADNVTPDFFQLDHATGGATTLSVSLKVGTWAVVLETNARLTSPAATPVNLTITQSATVDSTTVANSINLTKNASDSQTTHVRGIATGTLVVSAAATFTMSMAAVVVPSCTGTGSRMTMQRIS